MKLKLQLIAIKLAILFIIITNIAMANSIGDVILFFVNMVFVLLYSLYQTNK